MRSTLVAAAFVAGALAVPFHEHVHQKRSMAPAAYGDNVKVDVEVVYVTQVVTVTAGGKSSPKTTTTKEVPAPAAPTYEAPAPKAPSYEAPAAEPPASSPVASSPAAPAAPASGSYQDTCLHHHNIHRANHSVPALTWSDDLRNTAKKIAEGCRYAHDTQMDGGGYGQNIAAGVKADDIGKVITDMFYNGEEPLFALEYEKPSPNMSKFSQWGHFTQIVWKGTTEVGCYTYDCSGKGLGSVGSGVSPYFTVCNYKSPGNYAGQYKENVNRPGTAASAYGK